MTQSDARCCLRELPPASQQQPRSWQHSPRASRPLWRSLLHTMASKSQPACNAVSRKQQRTAHHAPVTCSRARAVSCQAEACSARNNATSAALEMHGDGVFDNRVMHSTACAFGSCLALHMRFERRPCSSHTIAAGIATRSPQLAAVRTCTTDHQCPNCARMSA
jgi:alkylation response protein AidB-like acyl-CoA dehydrogenase